MRPATKFVTVNNCTEIVLNSDEKLLKLIRNY